MFAVRKRTLAVAVAAGGLVSSAGLAAAALTQDPDVPLVRGTTKVTICHATSSDNNPYVQLNVDDDSIVKQGHGDHPDDIIPPFDYVEDGVTKHYPGLNWDDKGQPIWKNGCEIPPIPPPPPQPIQPFVKCVDANGATFRAVFGYDNPNEAAVTIPVGTGNAFDPGPVTGQPTTFQPGTVESAVTVTGASDVTWTITYGGESRTATATASFQTHCSVDPAARPGGDRDLRELRRQFGRHVQRDLRLRERCARPRHDSGLGELLQPGHPGKSPPSEFLPGKHAFTITGIPNGTELSWTLTTDTTRTAKATADFEPKCSAPPTAEADLRLGHVHRTSGEHVRCHVRLREPQRRSAR